MVNRWSPPHAVCFPHIFRRCLVEKVKPVNLRSHNRVTLTVLIYTITQNDLGQACQTDPTRATICARAMSYRYYPSKHVCKTSFTQLPRFEHVWCRSRPDKNVLLNKSCKCYRSFREKGSSSCRCCRSFRSFREKGSRSCRSYGHPPSNLWESAVLYRPHSVKKCARSRYFFPFTARHVRDHADPTDPPRKKDQNPADHIDQGSIRPKRSR